MEERAKGLMNQGAPWKKDVKWPIVAVEAAVLIVVGGFILFNKDTASDVILPLIGVVLLVTSAVVALASFREVGTSLGFYDAFRAGIGITAGAIATASWWSEYIADHAVRIILGWGLVAYGVLHIVGVVVVRGRAGLRLSVMITVGLTLVLGILLLTGDDTASDSRLNLLGTVLLVFGLLLAALAYYIYNGASKGAAPNEPTTAAAPEVAVEGEGTDTKSA